MDIYKIRWMNFRSLAGHKGGITEAAEKLGKSQGQVSHFGGKEPSKNIGEQIAREIEEAFELPPYWLDTLNHSAHERSQPKSNVGKVELGSQSVQLDPATLAEAYLLAIQEHAVESGGKSSYRLELDPDRTVRAYAFLVAGQSASAVAGYVAAAMRRGGGVGEVKDGKRDARGK